jgi:Histidine kinase
MPRRLGASVSNWLMSHDEAAVYGYAVAAFWAYTVLTRVLVRALWYQAMPSANMSSPGMFTLVHVIFAPALVVAHTAAYKVGFPDAHRMSATVRHLLILLFVLFMAKLSFTALSAYSMFKAGVPGWGTAIHEWLMDPLSSLGSSIELGSFYCIALGLAAGVINWRRYHMEAIARTELALDAERSRSMALRRQLDPHSLYNTLNAIAGSVRSAPLIAIAMLSSLGDLLRLTMRDDEVESTLSDEFEIAAKYLALYQLRYPSRLFFSISLEEGCGTVVIPPLLLQPLVENAALHGVNAGCAAVEVRLQAVQASDDHINITISNTSGPATQLVPPEQSSGIGLRNTLERLRLSYGSDFSFKWVEGGAGIAILKLKIPRAIPKSSSTAALLTAVSADRVPIDVRI